MNLADRIAYKLANSLGYDDEKRQVMAYGLGAAIQMLQLLFISIAFGCIFDCLFECMMIFWGVGLLRRSAGGIHCSSYMACVLTSSLSICLLSLVCRYLIPGYLPKWYYVAFGLVPGFACTIGFVWKRVPLSAPNKPISNPAKITRLRKECFTTLFIYLVISICLLMFDWGNGRNISTFCALIAVLWWQCFTLSYRSKYLIDPIDSLFQQ